MTNFAFGRVARAIAYWPPTGFVGANQQFFEQLGNGVIIEGLRMQFTIEKKLVKDPNSCTLIITNANEDTRARLSKKPLTVRLEAGHNGIARPLFLGNAKDAFSYRERTDWITKIIMGDGSSAYSYARVNRSYKRGTPMKVILRDIANAMGLVIPPDIEASDDLTSQIASGESIEGPARDELTRLLAKYGFNWSVQDGKLQILRTGQIREDRAWLIDGDTPIIGSPQYGPTEKEDGKPTLSLKCLMFPELTPGGKIRVRSRSVDGVFRIHELKSTGDTRGGDWYTDVKAKPV